jgi:hypothetical protein
MPARGGVRLPSPSLLDALLCLAVALLSAAPYLNSLEGNFCYDDKVAVGGNPDVVMPNVTLRDILTHDFWGNDILRRRCAFTRALSPSLFALPTLTAALSLLLSLQARRMDARLVAPHRDAHLPRQP